MKIQIHTQGIWTIERFLSQQECRDLIGNIEIIGEYR